jgi:glycosyltransferase involved in cell wall biosynthesis
MPVRNAAQWLDETFQSLMEQTIENMNIELSIYNDGSSASDFCIEKCLISGYFFLLRIG